MRKYIIGFVFGVGVAWIGASWSASDKDVTCDKCAFYGAPDAQEVIGLPWPRKRKDQIEALRQQNAAILEQLKYLQNKFVDNCWDQYGCQ